jgi:hypothetical protein
VSSYDPTDLRQQDDERQKEANRIRLAGEVEALDTKWLMSSKRGRRIVWRLLEKAGVFQLSFDTNALRMAFNEGNRNYGNKLLEQINRLCPELYPVMTKEQINGRSDGDGDNTN